MLPSPSPVNTSLELFFYPEDLISWGGPCPPLLLFVYFTVVFLVTLQDSQSGPHSVSFINFSYQFSVTLSFTEQLATAQQA